MPFEEAKKWSKGNRKTTYYADSLRQAQEEQRRDEELQKVVKPEEMDWDECAQGRLKHLCNEKTNARVKTVDLYIQEIPPGSRSGKHRHMAEEYLFILEGKGYDLHWDVDFELDEKYTWKPAAEPKRFDWQEGDVVFIPVNTVHQHFNADPGKPARFISGTNRMYKAMGFHDLEQIEDAPKS